MRTTSKHLQSFLLAIALAASAFPQSPAPAPAVPAVERLQTHIEYLASDKLEGRRTGSPGAHLAAEYIAHEFARYGLRRSIGRDLPGMSRLEAESPRRYMQVFPYVAGVELGKKNLLTIRSKEKHLPMNLRLGEDWMPLGFSSNGGWDNAPATFVGYGITATELNHDDYAKSQVKGRIAVALSGTPDGDNPHGKFARYEGLRWKAIAARNAGASALLVVTREENFKADRLSLLRYDNSGEAGLPVAAISRQAAAQLFQTDVAGLTKLTPRPSEDANQIPLVNFYTDVVRREVKATNVIGILDGSDPTLKNETIVIGAHFDHLGRGGEGSLALREGEVHHGADDNASGVAGVLELARIFSAQRPRRTIVFIAFSGEEEGLLGSNYYVNHPIVPLTSTVAMINMDMIGRMKDSQLVVGGVGTATEWRSMIEARNLAQSMTVTAQTGTNTASNGFPVVVAANGRSIVTSDATRQFQLTLNEDGFGPSDHSSFYAKQIPVLFFWTGTHEDYHKPSDTAEKINYGGEAHIIGLVADVIRDLDKTDKRPTYSVARSQSTGRSTGFRVYLGTIPNYADSDDGLLLDGVRDDSPAAKAGMKAGDKILKLAGRDVRNVYDYTAALGEMKADQEYEVELMRGAERIKLKITPTARK